MNRNTVQECAAQTIIPEPGQSETRDTAGASPEPRPTVAPPSAAAEQTPEYTYDPAKAARIADVLCELLDPEYILLFGKMAGRTPHSDSLAYDLLVITAGTPRYDWYEAKRYLKMKIPSVGHGAPYINIYVHTLHNVESNHTPFIYLARKEGIVLYRSHSRKYSRPKDKFDFGGAASAASRYAETFLTLAGRLVGYAGQRIGREHPREAAFATAQAAVYYYRTLFYVYHGFEAGTCDVRILHQRLRTLSGELALLFDSDEFRSERTLRCLNGYATDARYDPEFAVAPGELAQQLGRARRLGEVTVELCRRRIGLYDQRARQY